MGKDFRVGLITGVVLAGAALLWVATRPSLSPQARILQSPQAAPGAVQTAKEPLPWETDGPAEANETQAAPAPAETRPAQEAPPQPDTRAAQLPLPVQPTTPSPSSAVTPAPTRPTTADTSTSDLTIYETSVPIKTTRSHIVVKGETLSSISQKYYGASDKWQKILTANAKTVKNANRIAPGTKLIIPD
jgi:nucleoid-associated protein YgaU